MSKIKGFTIVELIVIVATIGILTSIVIVSYNGIQQRTQDAAVQSDLEAISGILESSKATSAASEFPRNKATLETLSIKATKGVYKTSLPRNFTYCISTSDYQSYALIAESKSGKVFMMTQDGFKEHSLTEASLTATLCNDLGMGLVSNGMFNPDTWQDWVGNG